MLEEYVYTYPRYTFPSPKPCHFAFQWCCSLFFTMSSHLCIDIDGWFVKLCEVKDQQLMHNYWVDTTDSSTKCKLTNGPRNDGRWVVRGVLIYRGLHTRTWRWLLSSSFPCRPLAILLLLFHYNNSLNANISTLYTLNRWKKSECTQKWTNCNKSNTNKSQNFYAFHNNYKYSNSYPYDIQ